MTAAYNYFRSELSSYFIWSDHGRELCWCNGTTIAFYEEITAALDRLVDENLPDFSTIALGLATLRNSWPETAELLTKAVISLKDSPYPTAILHSAASSREDSLALWPDSLRKLTLLTNYAESRSLSPSQRAELLAFVFRDFSSNYAAKTKYELADVYRAGLPSEIVTALKLDFEVKSLLLPESPDHPPQFSRSSEVPSSLGLLILRLVRTANSLAASLPFETVDQLDQLLKTGLADTVKAPDEPLLDQRAQTRSLLDQLSDDHELSGVARLAKQLIAAISLPRTLSEPDELQMGGVSDISNRGQLDQLLLSELAHDDLTLSVRLALNEALYLRRESPPSPLARTRAILIDLSLPMWGIPRLYATAAALALHATSDTLTRIDCYRSSRDGVVPSVLTTRDGLTEQLAALEPTEHPGSALDAFVAHVEEESGAAEPVIITTSDVLASESFRLALDKPSLGDLWLIVVERDGRLQVLQRTRQGTSIRKQLQLPLAEILSPKTVERVRRKEVPGGLPAIFHLIEFPLLLSHQTQVGRLWSWGDSAIAVTEDGRLMHWTEKGYGAWELTSGLAIGGIRDVCLIARSNDIFKLLICPMMGAKGTLVMLRNFSDGRSGVSSGNHMAPETIVETVGAIYQMQTVTDVFLTDSALLVFGKSETGTTVCSAINPETGECFGMRVLGGDLEFRVRRCMLTRDHGFCVLNWVDGHSNWVFQRLPEKYQGQLKTTETSRGRYVSLNQDGELVDPLEPERFNSITHQLLATGARFHEFRDVSIDGRFMVIGHQDEKQTIVDVENVSLVSAESLEAIEYEQAQKLIHRRVSHYKFARIGTDRHKIILMNFGGRLSEISLDRQDGQIRLEPSEGPGPTQLIEFQATPLNLVPKEAAIPEQESPGGPGGNFDVVLTDPGENLISVIKIVRSLNGLQLKEVKDLVESPPKLVKRHVALNDAEKMKAAIEAAGGRCEIRPAQSEMHGAQASYTLQKAEWPNGSIAWLDSRGLLHLKSANRSHPEITLVMRDGSLSGWLSSGEVFGDDYYCGRNPAAGGLRRTTAEAAWNSAIRPFIESVPWNFLFTSDTTQTGNTTLPGY